MKVGNFITQTKGFFLINKDLTNTQKMKKCAKIREFITQKSRNYTLTPN